jgi:hypothetical protein
MGRRPANHTGYVTKDEIASSLAPKGQAPRNDKKWRFRVIASDSKNRAAISFVTMGLFQQALSRAQVFY